jgi:DNA-binding PadR family transcriptional regulator
MSDKSRSAAPALYLGELEQLVLLAVLRRGDDAYGVTVRDVLAHETGRHFTLGTIYKTLIRLEEKGYLASREGEPSPERGGRRKRLYHLKPLGARSLEHSLESLRRLSRGVGRHLEAL